MSRTAPPSAQTARELPADVLQALQAQIDLGRTQVEVARALGVSPALVNQALRRCFRGNVDRFATRVRGLYLAASVCCPVLGQIDSKTCLDTQKRAEKPTFANPQRIALHRACAVCPHRQKG